MGILRILEAISALTESVSLFSGLTSLAEACLLAASSTVSNCSLAFLISAVLAVSHYCKQLSTELYPSSSHLQTGTLLTTSQVPLLLQDDYFSASVPVATHNFSFGLVVVVALSVGLISVGSVPSLPSVLPVMMETRSMN